MTDEKLTTKNWQKIADQPAPMAEDTVTPQTETKTDTTTTASGALEHPSYKVLEDKLTAAEAKAHDQWEKAMRAIAELENVRRRAERDVENAYKFGAEKLFNALLPIIDSLEQALQSGSNTITEASYQQMLHGIELTLQLFLDVLTKFNVKQLDPTGSAFNPQLHEAMTTQFDPNVPAGTVLTVLQKGYLLNERVIRPARVIVSKDKA